MAALQCDKYNVDPCFNYWTYGFDRVPHKKVSDWPRDIRMLLEHNRRRNFIIEFGQNFITDLDYCIECMKACPVGTEWEGIRPVIVEE